MSEHYSFSDQQKEIIKEYLEDNFLDASPNMPIDYEMVIRDIASHEGFFKDDQDADTFFSSKTYDEYFDAGRHQTLQTYEGYADFFKSKAGVDMTEKDYSSELGDDLDALEAHAAENTSPIEGAERYASEPQGVDSEASSSTSGRSESGEESKKRISHASREQAIEKLRQEQPKVSGDDVRRQISPDELKSLHVGNNVRRGLSSFEHLGKIPAFIINQSARTLGGVAGSLFGSTTSGFKNASLNRKISSAERTGVIPNPDIGKRLIDRKMSEISRQESALSKTYESLKADPGNQGLRTSLYGQSTKLMRSIGQASDAIETIGVTVPGIKDRYAGKVKDSGLKMEKFLKDQKFMDLKVFKSIQESMNKMMEKLSGLMKFKKDNEASPSA